LIESEEVESPAVYGFWRKWLLLPDGVFEHFSTVELRCIFLHELAHIKRGDLGVNWLVALLQVLHWFNPVLWLAWGRMRADRELATDALALAHVRDGDHRPYGDTILKVLEGLTGDAALPGLVGIAENKAQLKERLAAISRPGKHWSGAALAAIIALSIVGLTDAQTEKSKPDQAATNNVSATNSILQSSKVLNHVRPPLKAVVLLPDGTPVAGADVACKIPIPGRRLVLRQRKLESGRQGKIAQTAEDGSFILVTEEGTKEIVATDEKGFAKVALENVQASGKIILQPWGRIEGVLHIGSRLGVNEVVGLTPIGHASDFIFDGDDYQARTDNQGRFVIQDIPPGERTIVRFIYDSEHSWRPSHETNIFVKAGETTWVVMGGNGRTVLGHAALDDPGKQVDWTTADCRLAAKMPESPKFKTIQEQREWYDNRPLQRVYGSVAAADGSFRIEDVPPGDYDLMITITQPNPEARSPLGRRKTVARGKMEVTVAEAQKLGDTTPMELGIIPVKVRHPRGVGDMAAPLEALTFDGQPLRLEDYRGKYLMLIFEPPSADDEIRQLKEIAKAFAADKRLAMITVDLDPDPELAKEAAQRLGLNCVHGVVSKDKRAEVWENYCDGEGTPVPYIFLIDPQGKIIAKDLQVEDINGESIGQMILR
jgi:peroxiredoxin